MKGRTTEEKKQIKWEEQSSVRIDLLGGTIDFAPINRLLPHAYTLNAAINLMCQSTLTFSKELAGKIVLRSLDYNEENIFTLDEWRENKPRQGELKILRLIGSLFPIDKFVEESGEGFILETVTNIGPGSGLGTSSALAISLLKLMNRFFETNWSETEMIQTAQNIEGVVLNLGVAGIQDYYPAMKGGILCLKPTLRGIDVEQLYTKELAHFLEDRVLLVNTTINRNSGINNFEMFKDFFQGKDHPTYQGLAKIAQLSFQSYQAIKENRREDFLQLLGEEGRVRETLSKGIVVDEIKELQKELAIDVKVCGAGGGGHFLIPLLEKDVGRKDEIIKIIESSAMKVVCYNIVS